MKIKTKKNIKTKNQNEEQKDEIRILIKDKYFKMLFANPKHLETTTFLVSRILETEYKDIVGKVSLAPLKVVKEEDKKVIEERDIVVSLLTDDITKLILEANYDTQSFKYQNDYYLENRDSWVTKINRDIYYILGVYYNSLANASNYDKLPKVILVDFNPYFISEDKFMERCYFKTDSGHIVTDKLQIININIVKCYKLWYSNNYKSDDYNKYEQDLILLGAMLATRKKEDVSECLSILNTTKKIKKIFKGVIEKMDKDEEANGRLYNREEELKRIYEGAIDRAKRRSYAEGIDQNRREMVIAMYNNNATLEFISSVSSLSISEIEKIINDNKKLIKK